MNKRQKLVKRAGRELSYVLEIAQSKHTPLSEYEVDGFIESLCDLFEHILDEREGKAGKDDEG